jgi:predicted transcriptional regulator
MRRSKLEMQVEIMKVIAKKGPLQLSNIVNETNLTCNILVENIRFLIKQGLIEEIPMDKKDCAYGNTNRGTSVIRFFGEEKKLSDRGERKFLPVPIEEKLI